MSVAIKIDPERAKKYYRRRFLSTLLIQLFITAALISIALVIGINIVFMSSLSFIWISLVVWEFFPRQSNFLIANISIVRPGDPVLKHLSEPFQSNVRIYIGPSDEENDFVCSAALQKSVTIENKLFSTLTPIQAAKLAALSHHTRMSNEPTMLQSIIANQLYISAIVVHIFLFIQTSNLVFLYIAIALSAGALVNLRYRVWKNAMTEVHSPDDLLAMQQVFSMLESRSHELPGLFPTNHWSKFRLSLAKMYVKRAAANIEKS